METEVENQVKKGMKIPWSGCTLIGETWALAFRITLWLYKHVVIPEVIRSCGMMEQQWSQ